MPRSSTRTWRMSSRPATRPASGMCASPSGLATRNRPHPPRFEPVLSAIDGIGVGRPACSTVVTPARLPRLPRGLLEPRMELIKQLFDTLIHLDPDSINAFVTNVGAPLSYTVLFLIIFAETGLVVTPFLPGDSL